jgi:hypothetical protein
MMGYSESIVAASIGAAATLVTASFQLYSALRVHKPETRPKRGRTFRSILAILALMVASAVAGFMYSELRQQRTAEDLRSMREDLNARLQLLTTATQHLASERPGVDQSHSMAPNPAGVVPAVEQQKAVPTTVESEIYAPACEATTGCSEASAQRAALCGMIPGTAKVTKVALFLTSVGGDLKPEFREVEAGQDLGGAKFTGAPAEYKHDESRRSACVEFLHWSQEPHIARLVLYYDTAVDLPTVSAPPPAGVTTETSAQTLQPVSLSLAQSR